MVEKVSEQTKLVEDRDNSDAANLPGSEHCSESVANFSPSSPVQSATFPIDALAKSERTISGAPISFGKCVAAIIASGLAASALSSIVAISYSWGYLLVGSLFGQALEQNQGGIAAQSLAFAMSPFAFGWCFAYLKGLNKGGKMWAVLFSMFAIFGIFRMAGLGLNDLNDLMHLRGFSITEGILSLSLLAMAVGFCFGGYKLGERSYASLRTRVRVRALSLAGFIGICVPLLADRLLSLSVSEAHRSHFLSSFLLVHDFLLYAIALVAAGALASTFARARNRGSAVVLGLFAGSPIIIAALLNLSGNLLSLSLDHWGLGANIGWRALASAGFINVVTFAALSLGGLIGYRFSPQNPRKLLSGEPVLTDDLTKQPPLQLPL